ncbi:MAG: DUF1257 domain-containing protein [Myxococcales bacterium]|nr:DUF1257 domain-containing protein [Myxococcales bacterium]MCB9731481.1 DUF1257 domain-containing protein [Deltaproteobacteria bacterium]
MSHFTSVKTKIRDLACLVRALKDLSFEFTVAEEHEKVRVRGYQGQTTDCELSIHASKTYDIGVKLTADGTYEFVADWWGVETTRGVTEQDFIKQLTRRYSYHKVMEEIKKKGYTVESEEETENEQIQVRVRTWS